MDVCTDASFASMRDHRAICIPFFMASLHSQSSEFENRLDEEAS
jgi:hypothetical protein